MNFDLTSFVLGSLLFSLPGVYLLGKRHSVAWEVSSQICTTIAAKRDEQIQALLRTTVLAEPEQKKPTKGRKG